MKRRTEITIEIDRVMIISRQSNQYFWCEACGAEVEMITDDEAAIFAGATIEAVRRLALAGAIHSRPAGVGSLQICLASLLRAQAPEQSIETSLVVRGREDVPPAGSS